MIEPNLLLDISKYIYVTTIIFDSAVLLMLLLYKNARRFHYYFILALGLSVFWEVTLWIAFFVKLSPLAILTSNRLAFAAGPFMLYFILIFLHKYHEGALLRKYQLIILFLIALISTIACLTNILLTDISYYGSASYEYSLIKSSAIIWYYIFYGPISIAIFYMMYRILRDITGYRKRQAQYVVWGLLISLILGTVSNIWMPLFFNIKEGLVLEGNINVLVVSIQVIGAIAITIWTGVTAYAITRHRLFDIHFIIRRWLVESSIVTTVIGLILTLLYLITIQLDGQLKTFVWLALPFSVCGYFILARFLQTYRYRGDLDVSLSPDIINHDIAEQDMQNLLKSLHAKFLESYNVESTVVLYDWRNKYFQDTSTKSTAPLMLVHPLIAYLQIQNDPIFLSELSEPNSPITNLEHTRAIIQLFRERKAQAAVPLRDSFGLLGIVFISAQSDISKLYSRNTIADIQQISKVYGSAIQNVLTFQALTTKPE